MNQTYTAGQRVKVVEISGLDSPKLIGKHFTVKDFTELMIETVEICLENSLGNWLNKDQVELVEPSFKFTTGCGIIFSAYHPLDGTDEVLITWPEEPTGVIYSSLWVSRYLAKGTWKVVPKEYVQSLEKSTVTNVNLTLNDKYAQECSFLDAIKGFTEKYPVSVFIDSGKYIISYQDDELFAETDLDLRDVMGAVECLERAANGE
jgi:hypothetical protein